MSDIEKMQHGLRANEQIFHILEASKAITDKIFDEIPVTLIMLDRDRSILKINRTGQTTFMLDESKLLGRDLSSILPPDSVRLVDEYFDCYVENDIKKRSLSFERELKLGSKKHVFFWQICSAFHKDSREIHVLIGNDTTEARAAFEEVIMLNKDLEIARAAQALLLPKNNRKDTDFYRMAAHYEPAAKVGGDLWWDINHKGFYFGLVADVMGHGIGSAMVSSIAGGALSAFASKSDFESAAEVHSLFEDLHNLLVQICAGRYFISLSGVWFKKNGDHATIFMAGCPPVIFLSSDGSISNHSRASTPLGLHVEYPRIEMIDLPFKKGDRLICMTDGCYEFQVDGRAFGKRKLNKLFSSYAHESPIKICQLVAQDIKTIRSSDHPEDDVTFLVVERI